MFKLFSLYNIKASIPNKKELEEIADAYLEKLDPNDISQINIGLLGRAFSEKHSFKMMLLFGLTPLAISFAYPHFDNLAFIMLCLLSSGLFMFSLISFGSRSAKLHRSKMIIEQHEELDSFTYELENGEVLEGGFKKVIEMLLDTKGKSCASLLVEGIISKYIQLTMDKVIDDMLEDKSK